MPSGYALGDAIKSVKTPLFSLFFLEKLIGFNVKIPELYSYVR